MPPQEQNPFDKHNTPTDAGGSWLEKKVKKAVAITGIAALSMLPNKSFGQPKLVPGAEGIHPTSTWKYLGEDKLEAENMSSKYPGFLETYYKNTQSKDTDSYIFSGYTTSEKENAMVVRPPEDIKIDILRREAELAEYGDIPTMAKKQFEFQMTDEYFKQSYEKDIANAESHIAEQKMKIENLKSQKTVDADALKAEQDELTLWLRSLESTKAFPGGSLKTYPYETIVKRMQDGKDVTQKMIDDLQLELKNVEKYIAEHAEKK